MQAATASDDTRPVEGYRFASGKLTSLQSVVLSAPHDVNIWLGGGRGGSKTSSIARKIEQRCSLHRHAENVLIVRPGLYSGFRGIADEIVAEVRRAHGVEMPVSRGKFGETIMRHPLGARIIFAAIPSSPTAAEKKYQESLHGNNHTLIVVDEITGFLAPDVLDMLISTKRSGTVPCQMIYAGNPGGPGHNWVAQRWETGRPKWEFFDVEHGPAATQRWLSMPSTYVDNQFLPDDYLDGLRASAGGDEELVKAWVLGDWSIARGAYFARAIGPGIEIDWPEPPEWGPWADSAEDWPRWLCYDHGKASPGISYVICQSPGGCGPDGRYYPAGSRLLLDEWGHWQPNNPAKGLDLLVPEIAEGIIECLARPWAMRARGVADESVHADDGSGSVAAMFAASGVHWEQQPKTGRAARAQKMAQMLAAASARSIEKPGFFVSTRCRYWWLTVPYLTHDPADPQKVAKGPTDHGYDASSYGMDSVPVRTDGTAYGGLRFGI